MKPASTTRSGIVSIDRFGERRVEPLAAGEVAMVHDRHLMSGLSCQIDAGRVRLVADDRR